MAGICSDDERLIAVGFTGEELFLFSSDYPHPEGGRDPIARFESTLEGVPEATKQRFHSGNFAEMMFLA